MSHYGKQVLDSIRNRKPMVGIVREQSEDDTPLPIEIAEAKSGMGDEDTPLPVAISEAEQFDKDVDAITKSRRRTYGAR